MSGLDGVDSLGPQQKMQPKLQASVESKEPIAMSDAKSTVEQQRIESEMKEADHAFTLMMEISQKLKAAYNDLKPEGS